MCHLIPFKCFLRGNTKSLIYHEKSDRNKKYDYIHTYVVKTFIVFIALPDYSLYVSVMTTTFSKTLFNINEIHTYVINIF